VRGRAEQVTVAVIDRSRIRHLSRFSCTRQSIIFPIDITCLAMSPASYGIFAGSTIHEVAQVVAAGRSISEGAANTAVITRVARDDAGSISSRPSTYLSRSTDANEPSDAGDPSDAREPGNGAWSPTHARDRTSV